MAEESPTLVVLLEILIIYSMQFDIPKCMEELSYILIYVLST